VEEGVLVDRMLQKKKLRAMNFSKVPIDPEVSMSASTTAPVSSPAAVS
jgi:hypothetical protein